MLVYSISKHTRLTWRIDLDISERKNFSNTALYVADYKWKQEPRLSYNKWLYFNKCFIQCFSFILQSNNVGLQDVFLSCTTAIRTFSVAVLMWNTNTTCQWDNSIHAH